MEYKVISISQSTYDKLKDTKKLKNKKSFNDLIDELLKNKTIIERYDELVKKINK